MATRVLGPTGSRRRRRFLFVPILVVAAAALLLVGAAQAVHDETFQLDGDTKASTQTNVGGHAQTFDWDSFFNASGNPIQASFPDVSVPGFTASGFNRDFAPLTASGGYDTSDNTTYTQGSKDIDNVNQWVCTAAQNVTNKGDIQNAYAVAYTEPGPNGHQFIYFAQERNSNNGTANVAFWFLQDPTANCSAANGTTNFTGNHQDGDLFVVSTFTNGGVVSTINAYRWNGGAGGSLGTTAIASGGDCTATQPPAPLGDSACATVNKQTITGIPWLTNNNGKTNGLGNSLLTAEFFEGGVDLTQSGLAGKCFNTFVSNTRSSAEFTATLYDFSRASLGGCTSKNETTPVDNNGDPIPAGGLNIPADPNAASILVKDKATVTVTGASSFTGTLSWHLCGPFAAGTTTLCGTGGVAVDSQSITTNGTYTSAAATVTSAGRYCWRADFSASSPTGIPDASDSRASECFVVNPVKPTLTTQAGAGPVDFGNPVTDTATLTGTAHKPGSGGPSGSTDGSINPATLGGDATGTITFTLYKNDACTVLATGTGTNPQTRTVSGDGTYGPVSFTPDAPGTYHWVASYGGDTPNTLASDPSACLDENEDVVVRQIPTAIATTQRAYPADSATITSSVAGNNLGAGGTVQFRLFDSLASCTAGADQQTVGQGGLLYKESKTLVGGANSETVSTANTTVSVTANSTVYWRVTYAPTAGDTAHTGRQSACVENTALAFVNDAGPGDVFP
jgi:hypothetical protein